MLKSSNLALLLAATALAADLPLERYESAEPAMGTLARITLYARNPESARAAFQAAFARIHDLDATLSDYKPDSELNRLCRQPPGLPIRVSPDLFLVLHHAQRLSEQTDGAFDVTLGPLTRLWRQARKNGRVPEDTAIEAARRRVGYRHVTLDSDARTASLTVADMQLDLGGIAKGYAADSALQVLRSLGITSALVAISGDLALGDPPPGRPGWRIGIGTASNVKTLRNVCVSTSGDSEQFIEMGGVRYSHILDSATGMGVRHQPVVTVIALDGMTADSLATAISVAGRSTVSLPPMVQVIESHRSVSIAPHKPALAFPVR